MSRKILIGIAGIIIAVSSLTAILLWAAEEYSARDVRTTSGETITSQRELYPTDMEFDGSGNLWVANSIGKSLLMYEPKYEGHNVTFDFSTPLIEFKASRPNPSPLVSNTITLEFDKVGNLWVADLKVGTIQMFSDGDHDPLTSRFSNAQSPLLTLNATVTLDDVARVPYDAKITDKGSYWPISVAIDRKGNLWAEDGYGRRILMFSDGDDDPSTTNFVSGQNATLSLDLMSIGNPMTFDDSGNLWVNEYKHILMFSRDDIDPSSANFTSDVKPGITFTDSRIRAELRFDSTGNLWVTLDDIVMYSDGDDNPRTSLFVDGQNPTLTLQSSRDTIENKFSSSSPFAIDRRGNLWLYTYGYLNNRILMFSDGDNDPSTTNFVSGQNATSVYIVSQPELFLESG